MVPHLLLAAFALTADAGTVFRDDFSGGPVPERRASRGEWKFRDGVAACTQDDALYRKNKDHGPILFYAVPFRDATVRFAFKADGCKVVGFTANGPAGHVFRFNLGEKGSVRAFPPGGKPIGVADAPPLKAGEWVDVAVEFRGPKATIKIGKDYEKVVEHPTYATGKANVSIAFAFGTLSVRGLVIEDRKGTP